MKNKKHSTLEYKEKRDSIKINIDVVWSMDAEEREKVKKDADDFVKTNADLMLHHLENKNNILVREMEILKRAIVDGEFSSKPKHEKYNKYYASDLGISIDRYARLQRALTLNNDRIDMAKALYWYK